MAKYGGGWAHYVAVRRHAQLLANGDLRSEGVW
jgi:hypothetical protein